MKFSRRWRELLKKKRSKLAATIIILLGFIAPFDNPVQARWIGNEWFDWWLNGHLWWMATVLVLLLMYLRHEKKDGEREVAHRRLQLRNAH